MKQNATYLFRHSDNGFYHSQSRWSTMAQLALIYLSKNAKDGLSVYHSQIVKEPERWLTKSDLTLPLKGWSADNTTVEGNIQYLFVDKGKSLENAGVYPDIVYKNDRKKEIVLIVVRTIGRTLRGRKKEGMDNFDRYSELVANIKKEGWKCELYYLMSYGHEDEGNQCEPGKVDESKRFQDWKRLEQIGGKILLWEEVFASLIGSELEKYFCDDLNRYTLMPEWV